MPRLLIAGYGFLGVAIEPVFVNAGWEVDKLSRSGGDGAIACDISSSDTLERLSGDYDLIIHCAATGGGGEDGYRRVYLNGAVNLMNHFSKAGFIFTSSTSVYDQKDHSVVTEESVAEPSRATGKVLRETEEAVLNFGGIVARLSGLYGPGRCHILKNLLKGTASLDGKGERIMNFIHRDDVAKALLLIVGNSSSKGQIFNVSATPITQHDCYSALAKSFGLPIPLPASTDELKPRKRGDSSKAVSNEKLCQLGWIPEYADFLSIAKSQDIEKLLS